MKFGSKVKSAMTGLALLVNGCGTNLCPLLRDGEECGQNDPRHAWIYEHQRFSNNVDLRLANGIVEYKRISGTDNEYSPIFECSGDYCFVITNLDGEVEFKDKISIGADYKTVHWPARNGQETLKILDENCNPVLLRRAETSKESYSVNVFFVGSRP